MTCPIRAGVGRFVAVVLLAVPLMMPAGITVAPSAPVRADELADRIAASRQRQEDLVRSIDRQKTLIGELKADENLADLALAGSAAHLDTINTDQGQVRREIQQATEALASAERRRASLVAELRGLDWTVALLEAEIAQSEIDVAALRERLGERLADAYRSSQTSLLEQILDASSFAEVVTGVDAHLRFGEQDAELARLIEADQAELDALRRVTIATRYNTDQLRLETVNLEAALRARHDALAASRARLADLEERTLRLQEEQRAEFSRIVSDQEEAERRLADEEFAEDQLASSIGALIAEAERQAEQERLRLLREQQERERERELARQEAQERAQQAQEAQEAREALEALEAREARERAAREQAASSGFLSWPVSGTVTQEFGCTGFAWEPRRGDCAHFHEGIDISNADGTPIRAAASGVVAFAGRNPYQSGNDRAWIVIIGHAQGYVSWYVHLQARYAPNVRRGSRVDRGQVIGYMGNTGYSTGTHLHWEVRRGGTVVNPRGHI